MRELTPNEIENAPDWATNYIIMRNKGHRFDDTVCYIDIETNKAMWLVEGKEFIARSGLTRNSMPIPRKEFDINSVRLSDDNIDCLGHCNDEILWTYFKADTAHTSESRADVIAKAKHFKLTADDLR